MRRMREMSAMQPGMSFYGEMPDSFNFVLNTDHPLIKKVLTEEEQACDEKLKPILSDIKGWEARQADLREAQSKKKEIVTVVIVNRQCRHQCPGKLL